MKQIGAIVLVLSAGTSVAYSNPFIGTYLPQSAKEDGQSCQSLAGSFDGKTPYRIDEGWIEYLEAGCYLKKPKDIGGGAIRYSANCAVEGSEYTEKLTIAPVDKGILLRGDGWEEYWQLCSAEIWENSDSAQPEAEVNYNPNEVRCYMNIKGKVLVDGPCDVDIMGDGMVNFDVQGDNLSNINTDGQSMSAWNGGSGYLVTTSLGILNPVGEYCYTNQDVAVCFGMPK